MRVNDEYHVDKKTNHTKVVHAIPHTVGSARAFMQINTATNWARVARSVCALKHTSTRARGAIGKHANSGDPVICTNKHISGYYAEVTAQNLLQNLQRNSNLIPKTNCRQIKEDSATTIHPVSSVNA